MNVVALSFPYGIPIDRHGIYFSGLSFQSQFEHDLSDTHSEFERNQHMATWALNTTITQLLD